MEDFFLWKFCKTDQQDPLCFFWARCPRGICWDTWGTSQPHCVGWNVQSLLELRQWHSKGSSSSLSSYRRRNRTRGVELWLWLWNYNNPNKLIPWQIVSMNFIFLVASLRSWLTWQTIWLAIWTAIWTKSSDSRSFWYLVKILNEMNNKSKAESYTFNKVEAEVS